MESGSWLYILLHVYDAFIIITLWRCISYVRRRTWSFPNFECEHKGKVTSNKAQINQLCITREVENRGKLQFIMRRRKQHLEIFCVRRGKQNRPQTCLPPGRDEHVPHPVIIFFTTIDPGYTSPCNQPTHA